MIPHEKQEWGISQGFARTPHRVPVTEGLRLFDKAEPWGKRSGGLRERGNITGSHHDHDFLDTGLKDFFNENLQRRLWRAISVYERLKRKAPLAFACCGDEGLGDLHVRIGGWGSIGE